jgi:hypothetical protein
MPVVFSPNPDTPPKRHHNKIQAPSDNTARINQQIIEVQYLLHGRPQAKLLQKFKIPIIQLHGKLNFLKQKLMGCGKTR